MTDVLPDIVDSARSVYAAFERGDIPVALALFAPEIRWTEALGGAYGGTSVGPQAVLENVFMKLGSEWDGFAAVVDEFVASGNTVVALGTYHGVYMASGKRQQIPFAHAWKFENGLAVEFQQYTDTALQLQVMA
jgi:ketosteroid isomerase-like protein